MANNPSTLFVGYTQSIANRRDMLSFRERFSRITNTSEFVGRFLCACYRICYCTARLEQLAQSPFHRQWHWLNRERQLFQRWFCVNPAKSTANCARHLVVKYTYISNRPNRYLRAIVGSMQLDRLDYINYPGFWTASESSALKYDVRSSWTLMIYHCRTVFEACGPKFVKA